MTASVSRTEPPRGERVSIGIDIGGTKVAGGVVDEHGSITARLRRDTPHRSTAPSVVEDVIVGVVETLMADLDADSVAAVGIGAAGFVAADRATVAFAPHLSWRDEPLRDRLAQRLTKPVFIDNDGYGRMPSFRHAPRSHEADLFEPRSLV